MHNSLCGKNFQCQYFWNSMQPDCHCQKSMNGCCGRGMVWLGNVINKEGKIGNAFKIDLRQSLVLQNGQKSMVELMAYCLNCCKNDCSPSKTYLISKRHSISITGILILGKYIILMNQLTNYMYLFHCLCYAHAIFTLASSPSYNYASN